MPRVVRFYETGGPRSLKIEEEPRKQPKEGEVRLKVKAVGLNRAEALFTRGQYLEQPKLPSGIGYEAAGVVDAVGPGVDKAWLGKTVATIPAVSMSQYGMLGEEVLAPVKILGEYPEKLSPEEGAAIWMQYLTAYCGLLYIGKLTRGEFVILPAASSSVGLAAVEIAKAEGAISIATTRKSAKKQELLALGADHVIATEEEDFVSRVREITGGQGARVSFDPIAGRFVEKLAEAASYNGILVEYGSLGMEVTPFPLVLGFKKGLTMRAFMLMEITTDPAKLEEGKKYVYERLADGRFRPKIAKVFPFEQTVEAYEYLESNAQVGKVVIRVA